MPNDHYVQRALIKAWAARLPNGRFDGEVRYYDFNSGKVEKASTRDLFVKEGLNSPDVEARLGREIENQLSRLIRDDTEHRSQPHIENGVYDFDSVQMQHALALSFVVQIARANDGLGLTTGSLKRVLAMSDATRAGYVSRCRFSGALTPRFSRALTPGVCPA